MEAACRKKGPRAHNTLPPTNLALLAQEGQCRGWTEPWLGAQTEMQRARLWERTLVHLSGLDDNMGVWVPDAVVDTHSILCTHSLGHRCHDDHAHFRDEQTKIETVTHLHSHLRTMYLDP